jgi:hypothetical protein
VTTNRTRTAIASGTCLTLGVAVAVALGAVPRATSADGPSDRVIAAAASQSAVAQNAPHHLAPLVTHHAAAHLGRTAHLAQSHHAVTSTVTTPAAAGNLISTLTVQPAAASLPAEAANIKHPAHHKRKHHHKRRHHHHRAAKPTLAPRTTPSSSAVSNAIAGLRQYVNSPFTPTAKQVAQFGNDVCTAFDQGHTYSSVIGEVQQKVQQIPFTSLKSGGADYVVKTAVSLYCPGYKSKLG